MLDDAFKVFTRSIIAWTPRDLMTDLRLHADEQRRRRRAWDKLEARGACLGIDALAENAIAAGGASLAACAPIPMKGCAPGTGAGPKLAVPQARGGTASIRLHRGCVTADLLLEGVGVVRGSCFMLDHVLPKTAVVALAGRPADAIVDHPYLRQVTIASAQGCGTARTMVRLKVSKRLVDPAEPVGPAD